ncbi:catechol 2,3-dioxygenase-like lactoylglutathione lyase family enzyme [Solirubrobacter pauli]|uniref:Catechol 2,3-dioxygenase-like lactoylglutathione lyase family enzyme n=1 Tax=Solirubrobacter pauli TaxID=166793 RepID=A0A660LGT6_9ACTN|nr:VOC family protein [Solirubrobacter pauli]RKQ91961.1 catechol 2,3-dioxygenase-like lactoylglutathione lyase family enzyme [Solirubrobacter pauli]
MAIPVTGVSELVLEVVDLAAAEAFYSGILGLPVVDRWPDREALWVMAGDRTRIGLWRPQVGLERGRGGVHVHFAMHILPGDYDNAVSELRAAGLDVREHEFSTRPHSRAAYVDDPDATSSSCGPGTSRITWTAPDSRAAAARTRRPARSPRRANGAPRSA